MRPRLYLDEDVTPELARALRGQGYDVVSAHEVPALGLSDEEQLAWAASEGRALLSYNYTDFLRITREWFMTDRNHAGVILSYRQYSHRQFQTLRRTVVSLLDVVEAEDLENSVYVLDQFR